MEQTASLQAKIDHEAQQEVKMKDWYAAEAEKLDAQRLDAVRREREAWLATRQREAENEEMQKNYEVVNSIRL